MRKGAILLLILFLLSGCGVVKRGTVPWDENKPSNTPEEVTYTTPEDDTAEMSSDDFVDEAEPLAVQEMQQFLQLAYQDWKGTPYLLGGSGYTGIDCSAFMQVVFEDYFSREIPRTTRQQLTVGERVQRSGIQTGDLVFFKTGQTSYHVGVMVNRQEFLHASTSSGVKLSELDHPFWQETYLMTRRIF